MITQEIPGDNIDEVTNEVRLKKRIIERDQIIKEQGLFINEQGEALIQKDHEIEKLKLILQKNNITVMD